ncbi:MAG: hypothetical protein JWO50_25 [Candidatus Kaiserbacteria bacterium]|nr:hypothetical protein [Candidatus Kaiserbacteria bacterium]
MLNKSRLENLSDGLFAIVLTLLVFDIKLPIEEGIKTNATVYGILISLEPLFIQFLISFVVLAMFWISHNFFYSYFALTINRTLVLLNLVYLGLISFIPFSARLLGSNLHVPLAIMFYGFNILLISFVNVIIFRYALYSHEIDTGDLESDSRLFKQATIRQNLTVVSTLAGIVAAYFSTAAALLLYSFPIIFNIIPGSLNMLERIFGFKLE